MDSDEAVCLCTPPPSGLRVAVAECTHTDLSLSVLGSLVVLVPETTVRHQVALEASAATVQDAAVEETVALVEVRKLLSH